MKALWRHDWYRIGRGMTAVLSVLFLLTMLFYWHLYQTVVPHYLFKNMAGNRIFWYTYNNVEDMPVIWLFPLMTAGISAKLVSDDRHSGWYRLCCAMPLTGRQYVTEKYLFGLAFMGAGMVAVMLCQTIYVSAVGVFDGWFLTLFFLRLMTVALSLSAVLTVLTFRRGFAAALLWLIFLLVLLGLMFSLFGRQWFGEAVRWLLYQPKGIVCGSAAAIGLYGLSCCVCLRTEKI